MTAVQEQLIEYAIQDVLLMIMQEHQLPWDRAMKLFYGSWVFEKLNDIETGLYLRSPGYIYELFLEEERGDLPPKDVRAAVSP